MKTQEAMERYRQNPISGTDFSKPVSVLIEEIRNDITRVRGKISDISFGTGWGDRVDHVEGLLTCALVTLAHSKEEIREVEIRRDDATHGESVTFSSRGIGCDQVPCCFVCGAKSGLYDNIAALVKSRADGDKVVSWFGGSYGRNFRQNAARLDYRSGSHIQVKVGTCHDHLPQLEELHRLTSVHGVIRQSMIKAAREFKPNFTTPSINIDSLLKRISGISVGERELIEQLLRGKKE